MRNFVIIVGYPNKLNPGNVVMVVEFMQHFQQQPMILHLQVDYASPPLVFGLQTNSQDARELFLSPSSDFLCHKQNRLSLSRCSKIFGRILIEHIA